MEEQLPPNNNFENDNKLTHITYLFHALSIITGGVTGIFAIVVNYIKRNDVRGTILESHFTWRIRTFWITVAGFVIGFVLISIWIGFPILLAAFLWFVYRIAKGWVLLNDGKPIPNPKGFK